MYRSLNDEMREKFGEKVYKLALEGGFSCPNRDGTLGKKGLELTGHKALVRGVFNFCKSGFHSCLLCVDKFRARVRIYVCAIVRAR